MRKPCLLAGALFLSTMSIHAQETAQELDPVTITNSLAPEKTSRTGRNIIVIGGERFYQLPVNSVDELLRYVPGVEIQARGPMGAQSDIVLRGGTFQQVLVILDGVRLNDPNTGHFSAYIPISPAEIDRVEVLKGAASAIYGSEAVGGVVHIMTKSFSAARQKKESKLTAQATGGQYGLWTANAGGMLNTGETAISGGLLSNNATGQLQRGTRGFFYNQTGSLSFHQYLGKHWRLGFRTAYDRRRFSAQNFYTTFVSDTASEKVETFWNQLFLGFAKGNHRVQASGGYKRLNDLFSFNAASTANRSRSTLFQGLITDTWLAGKNTQLTTGLQFISKKIQSNDRGDHTVRQAAAFVVLNQQLTEALTLSPALRVEWNERAGWELVPQLNASYRTGKLQLRASGGKTIRDADFTERYNNYNRPFVASGRIGNPDLEAERSVSYEAGADLFVNSSLKLSSTFFQRFHSRLIDYVNTPYQNMPRRTNLSPTGTYALAKNIAEVNTTGVETDLQYTRSLGGPRTLYATLGMVWLRSTSSDTTPSFYLSSHARYLTNFTLRYANRVGALSFTGIYKDRAPQAGASPAIAKVERRYFVLNARAEAFLWRRQLALFVQADNVFNQAYTDLLGSQMPGRWLMGGLRITLSK
jgi:vitamin B12 transporter